MPVDWALCRRRNRLVGLLFQEHFLNLEFVITCKSRCAQGVRLDGMPPCRHDSASDGKQIKLRFEISTSNSVWQLVPVKKIESGPPKWCFILSKCNEVELEKEKTNHRGVKDWQHYGWLRLILKRGCGSQ